MSSALGDFLLWVRRPQKNVVANLDLRAIEWPPIGSDVEARRHDVSPEISIWCRGDVLLRTADDAGGVAVVNAPTRMNGGSAMREEDDRILKGWMQARMIEPRTALGRYCYALWDVQTRRVTTFTDAFRTCSIYYATTADQFVCGTDLRLILATGSLDGEVDPRSLYHYLNFSYIPAPWSAIKGIYKLPAGTLLSASPGELATQRYWDPRYVEDLTGDTETLSAELRDQIVASVRRYRPLSSANWGAFLSGGTDSSSIAGILAREPGGGSVSTFSIGFGESEFDELGYARIAAAHFSFDAHMRIVSEDDAVDVLPRIVRTFDEPFGNASAIPTHYCAMLAQQFGVTTLVAGDGGDEIFGGNDRYRKDKILEWFYRAPRIVRKSGELTSRFLSGVDSRWANRLKNFVQRGSLPNPDRFYSDDSFVSDHFAELLTEDFRGAVGRDDSLNYQRHVYGEADARCDLHKLMYLDLKMTIADNDIVKVTRAGRLAGIGVVFPYLDRDLIEYTGRLPCKYKVSGLRKRYLFKRAMRDILPQAILEKTKQGFGLPVSVWLRRQGRFRELVNDIVFAQRAASRGYFNMGYVRSLLERHQRGAWDYSPEIYRLLMLELWHKAYLDNHGA
jgi:asparagine synthase (glutamine-hydrolysing)